MQCAELGRRRRSRCTAALFKRLKATVSCGAQSGLTLSFRRSELHQDERDDGMDDDGRLLIQVDGPALTSRPRCCRQLRRGPVRRATDQPAFAFPVAQPPFAIGAATAHARITHAAFPIASLADFIDPCPTGPRRERGLEREETSSPAPRFRCPKTPVGVLNALECQQAHRRRAGTAAFRIAGADDRRRVLLV